MNVLREKVLTLAVDSATEKRSVAVLRGERCLSVFNNHSMDSGSARILSDIEEALALACVRLEDIELFTAAVGPGSFTGLRAGVATIKGLALTLDKPVVGIQTLHAVAHSARPSKRLAALIPAGRGEVFAQILSVGVGGEISEIEQPTHVQPALLIDRVALLGEGIKWAGGGAQKFETLIRDAAASNGFEFVSGVDTDLIGIERTWVIAPLQESLAENIALLALQGYMRGEATGAESLRAIYVRPSDAELNG